MGWYFAVQAPVDPFWVCALQVNMERRLNLTQGGGNEEQRESEVELRAGSNEFWTRARIETTDGRAGRRIDRGLRKIKMHQRWGKESLERGVKLDASRWK